jgi:hypothetical protein
VQVDPDSQTRRRKIHCKQELIIANLQRFYTSREDTGEILELLQGTSNISLRLVDWFVTNYARQNSTSYILNNQEFLVYMNYKSQLKAYSKKLFDPFCRRERIMFQLPNHESFVTTVGKLNFFRWAIEKGVIDFIKLNFAKIEKEMNTNAREVQKIRKQSEGSTQSGSTAVSTQSGGGSNATTRRRTKTSTNQAKVIEKHELNVEVSFA